MLVMALMACVKSVSSIWLPLELGYTGVDCSASV